MDGKHVQYENGSSEEEHKKIMQMRDLVEKQDSTSKVYFMMHNTKVNEA